VELARIHISAFSPHLVINLDEIGFSASKSGRSKSGRVGIPEHLHGMPVARVVQDARLITAFCAISAAGDLLRPDLIAKRDEKSLEINLRRSLIFQATLDMKKCDWSQKRDGREGKMISNF
jgi:hypothetical protein